VMVDAVGYGEDASNKRTMPPARTGPSFGRSPAKPK